MGSHRLTSHQTSHLLLHQAQHPQHEGRRSPHPPGLQPRPLRPLPPVQQLPPVSDLHRRLLPAEQPEPELQLRWWKRIWRIWWKIWRIWRLRKIELTLTSSTLPEKKLIKSISEKVFIFLNVIRFQ